jgi:predicted MPP superfamily phosphohydrolase
MNFDPKGVGEAFDLPETEGKIKDLLKKDLPEDVYIRYVENFCLLNITPKEVIFGYSGKDSLKEFNRQYRQKTWIHVTSVVGGARNLVIQKRRVKKPPTAKEAKTASPVRTALFFLLSALFFLAAFGAFYVASNYNTNREFDENFYSVASLNANNKVRVMQISDLHQANYGEGNSQILSRAQKLSPDLIVLTGDCLNSNSGGKEETIAFCASLAKIAPTYYVYGNNEILQLFQMSFTQKELDEKFGFDETNRNPEAIVEMEDPFGDALAAVGVKVLKNQMDTVTVGETKVDIFGVVTSNPSSFPSYAAPSFEEYLSNNPDHLKITAFHEPTSLEFYTDFPCWGDLILAGHTHGGMAIVPFVGPAYTHEGGVLPEKKGNYVYGRYEVASSPLIVSSGLDNSNPLRLNNPPEIVIVDVNTY